MLGAGNMGAGIAQAFAQAGFSVVVRDLTEEFLERGRRSIGETLDGGVRRGKVTPARRTEILDRIRYTTDLGDAGRGAALVVEAVFEEMAVKRAVFDELAPHLAPDAIVATNTSSLSVSALASGLPHPDRFAGLHFFFPAAINKLLEVVGGKQTSEPTVEALLELGYRLRKIPIRVADRAGFAVNRFFVPYLNEAARLAGDGTASLGTIEAVGRELTGAALGPFELMNVTGVPIAYHSMRSLESAFGRAYAPAPRLEEQFHAKRPWEVKGSPVVDADRTLVRARFEGLVFGIAAELVDQEVATAEAVEIGATVGLRWRTGPFGLMGALGLPTALGRVEAFAARYDGAFPVAPRLVELGRAGVARWPLRYVRTERDGPVAWVLLDRPQVMNALSTELLEQLERSFDELDRDPSVRAVILAGASPVFCAGADIAEMAEKDPVEGRRFGFVGQATTRAIERCHAPVIALVEGYALGGGFELALACDLIVAADGAKLGLPEVTVGIHPGMGGASRLTRRIGRARTKFLVFTGEPVPAREAERWGFVERIVPADEARSAARALAGTIASRAPLAVAWAKSVIDRGMDSPLESALRLEGESAGHTFVTEDRTEGMRAFLERRRPDFKGR